MTNSTTKELGRVDKAVNPHRKNSNAYLQTENARLEAKISLLMSDEQKTVSLHKYVIDKESDKSVYILPWKDLVEDIKARILITAKEAKDLANDTKKVAVWVKETGVPTIRKKWRDLMDAVDTKAPSKDSSDADTQ
tara:strand:- start:19 stop:426 length:408 start_codon:yes stop_codon:yes gene_type:complete